MKRWLLTAAAALLTLGGLTLIAAPAMARDHHARPAHVTAHVRGAARHHARAWRAARARYHRHGWHRR